MEPIDGDPDLSRMGYSGVGKHQRGWLWIAMFVGAWGGCTVDDDYGPSSTGAGGSSDTDVHDTDVHDTEGGECRSGNDDCVGGDCCDGLTCVETSDERNRCVREECNRIGESCDGDVSVFSCCDGGSCERGVCEAAGGSNDESDTGNVDPLECIAVHFSCAHGECCPGTSCYRSKLDWMSCETAACTQIGFTCGPSDVCCLGGSCVDDACVYDDICGEEGDSCDQFVCCDALTCVGDGPGTMVCAPAA